MNAQTVRRLFIGLLLIGIGVLFLAGQLGYVNINPAEIAPTYWPVILIVLGLNGLITDRKGYASGSFMWSLFMIALGGFFLLRNLGYTDMNAGEVIKLLIPVFIILFGIRMIMKPSRKPEAKKHGDAPHQYEYKYEYKYDDNSDSSYAGNYDNPPPADPLQDPLQEPQASASQPEAPQPQAEQKQKHAHHHYYHHNKHGAGGNSENRSGFIGDLYLGNDYWELKPMNVSHFIGDTTIDLTKAHIPAGETKLNISAFIGDVKVYVLNDVDIEFDVNSSSFLGDITVFGRKEGGFMRSMREVTPGYPHSDKKIKLNCNLFIGDIQVQRVG